MRWDYCWETPCRNCRINLMDQTIPWNEKADIKSWEGPKTSFVLRKNNLEKVIHIFTDSLLIMPNVSQVTAVTEASSNRLIHKDYIWDLPNKLPWQAQMWLITSMNTKFHLGDCQVTNHVKIDKQISPIEMVPPQLSHERTWFLHKVAQSGH
jgi:hypothetical protein